MTTTAASADGSGNGSGDAGRVRVLHVDDDPAFVEMAAARLERASDDLAVTIATSAREGLDRLETESFACVVSDYRMPEMDGIEFLRAVRESHPDLPFVLLTGKGSEAVASEAIAAGATDYLRKERFTDEAGDLAAEIHDAVDRERGADRFETFLEAAPDSMIVVDTDGTIERVNSRTTELFGYDRDEVRGEPIEVLLPDRFREDHVDHRERYVEAPETRPMGADLDLYARRADGSEFPVDISISPIEVGGATKVMAAVRDVTEQEQREAQLREREAALERQNERLEEFASVVSHDLRNPLTVAHGNLDLYHRTDDLGRLGKVERALNRMETLIDDLLTLARQGRTVENPQPVDLSRIVDEVWETVASDGGTVERAFDDNVAVFADEGRLKQLLENLFRNAVEHGGPGVTIRVELSESGLVVEDDGPGIPADDRDEIFDRGYTTREEGSGFGLAIVRSIVDAHGWDVDVTEGDEGGARFEITGVERTDACSQGGRRSR